MTSLAFGVMCCFECWYKGWLKRLQYKKDAAQNSDTEQGHPADEEDVGLSRRHLSDFSPLSVITNKQLKYPQRDRVMKEKMQIMHS